MALFPSIRTLFSRDITGSVVVLGSVGGDINVDSLPFAKLTLDWHPLRKDQPELSWLDWRTRIAEFRGRERENADLLAWAETEVEGSPVLARFVTGPGGVGKTRLAAEVAQTLRDKGWNAGFADLRKPSRFRTGLAGMLVIVDYPEERPGGVRDLLEDLARIETRHRVRLLFLSRRGWSVWEREIAGVPGAINFFAAGQTELEPLAAPDAYRVFRSAREALAKEKKADLGEVTETAFGEWLRRADIHRHPLFVAAAAVHGVLYPDVPVVKLSGREVLQALAQRELSRLEDEATAAGLEPEALRHLVAFAAIRGDLDGGDLRALAGRTDLALMLPPTEDIVAKVERSGRLRDGVFPEPKPDILAAYLVVEVFRHDSKLAPERLWAAIKGGVGEALPRAGRLAYDAEMVLGLLDHRISGWLERMVEGKPERWPPIAPAIRDASLTQGLVPLATVVWGGQLTDAKSDEERADLLNNLSVHLGETGDVAGALAASTEAVEVSRRLAAANPARFEPDLASILNNLSIRLGATGDVAGALAAITEAVEIRRRLAAANPARFESDLAASLGAMGSHLRANGQAAKARAAFEEGVRIVQFHAERYPDGPAARLLAALRRDLESLDAGDG